MKKIILFGAGDNGKKAIDFFGCDRVEYFVDNNEQKIGQIYCDRQVISVAELKKIWKNYDIVVTANCYGEIVEQLKREGITEYTKFLIPNISKIMSYIEGINWDKYCNAAIYGADEYTMTLLKKIPDEIREKIRCILTEDIDENELFEGYPIHKVGEKELQIDCVIITSPLYHIAKEIYLNKVLINTIDILNPYRMDTYYSKNELVINKYVDQSNEAANEQQINEKNRNRTDYFNAVKEYVKIIKDDVPLFKLVEIETINRCNGVCEFCPVNAKDDPREKHIMSEELFYNIINQLEEMDYSGRISLFSNNEPFLDNRILMFSKYMREHLPHARIHMFTNGTLLDLDKFKAIIPYLDELIIDNYTQDLHLIKNSEDIKNYCNENTDLIKKVSIVLRKPKEILSSRGGSAPNRKEQQAYPDVTCALPFQQLIVRPTGEVSLCCNDALGKYTLGDLNKESILDVWYGERYKKYRNAIIEGRKNIEICKTCDVFSLYL